MGLAWTSLGGNALYIEAAIVEKGEGKGGLRTTGQAPRPISLASLKRPSVYPIPGLQAWSCS
jgi:Lon protease (S16) C-terminal proteolytic domain